MGLKASIDIMNLKKVKVKMESGFCVRFFLKNGKEIFRLCWMYTHNWIFKSHKYHFASDKFSCDCPATIGDNVVIHANAIILGGETVIGNNSIIVRNAWVACPVNQFSKISANMVIKQ